MTHKPRLWAGKDELGDVWMEEETLPVPYGLTISGLTELMKTYGVPDGATLEARTEYEENGPEVMLVWYVRIPPEQMERESRELRERWNSAQG